MPIFAPWVAGISECLNCEMPLRSRMSLAPHLLLETGLSIKEIATQMGYQRQHEFWRAFRKAI